MTSLIFSQATVPMLTIDVQVKREQVKYNVTTFWYVVLMTNWGAAMVFNPYGLFFTETDEEKAFVSSLYRSDNQVFSPGEYAQLSKRR